MAIYLPVDIFRLLGVGRTMFDRTMTASEFWKNFQLGEEVALSGVFVYNGLRKFLEIDQLDYHDELFEALYNLSVGIERILKISVVLIEHDDNSDQEELEKSLITHNLIDLLARVRRQEKPNLSKPHNEFLSLLTDFYRSHRYDRFSLSSLSGLRKERDTICRFFEKYLNVEIGASHSLFGTENKTRYKQFLQKLVFKICRETYEIVVKRSRSLGLYTYELRYNSKSYIVFLGSDDLSIEQVAWKEVLVYLMNTSDSSGYLEFLRGIEPLELDAGLIESYLECFQKEAGSIPVLDEIQHHYSELERAHDRAELMSVIGMSGLYFEDDEGE